MAIGFLKMSTISRNSGATACARMAYICRSRIAGSAHGKSFMIIDAVAAMLKRLALSDGAENPQASQQK